RAADAAPDPAPVAPDLARAQRAPDPGLWFRPALSARLPDGSGALHRRHAGVTGRRPLAQGEMPHRLDRGGCTAFPGRVFRPCAGGAWIGGSRRLAAIASAIVEGAGAGRPPADRGAQPRQPVGAIGELAFRAWKAVFAQRTRFPAQERDVRARTMEPRALCPAYRQPGAYRQRGRLGEVWRTVLSRAGRRPYHRGLEIALRPGHARARPRTHPRSIEDSGNGMI